MRPSGFIVKAVSSLLTERIVKPGATLYRVQFQTIRQGGVIKFPYTTVFIHGKNGCIGSYLGSCFLSEFFNTAVFV